jgi:hypothetical protein
MHNTSFSSQFMNLANELERYITLCRKGLVRINTLAYWAHL